jgi:DNA-binding response OmpR family regulator
MIIETTRRRIVVADHDRTILELLQIRLSIAGFDVFVERTGPAALETVRRVKPAALLLELNLPEMDGLNVMQCLGSRGDGIAFPILVMGRKLGPDDIQRAVRLGARDCLIKPFSGADVVERVERIFRRPPPAQPPSKVVYVENYSSI